MFKNKKGFTLIEMVVVIAVVAILMSIIAIRIGRGPTGQAYDTRRMSDLQKVQTYLELYYTKNRVYPGANISTWTDLNNTLAGAGIGINSIPNDPLGAGYGYFYCYSGDYQDYILGARLSTSDHASLRESSEVESTAGYSCTFDVSADCIDGNNGYCIQP